MRLQVKAQKGHVSASVRAYAEKRFAKLERRLHELTLVELTLSHANNPSISDAYSADAIVHAKGPTLVARESAPTYQAAIDLVVDKLERQIERYRDKRTHEPRRDARQRTEAAAGEPEVGTETVGEQGEAAA